MKEIIDKLDIVKMNNFLPAKDNVKINEDINHTIGTNICKRHYLRNAKNPTVKKTGSRSKMMKYSVHSSETEGR